LLQAQNFNFAIGKQLSGQLTMGTYVLAACALPSEKVTFECIPSFLDVQ
jgi:hypothetical protein